MNKTIFEVIFFTVFSILCLDFICYGLWASSGQIPEGWFYFGSLTAHTLAPLFH